MHLTRHTESIEIVVKDKRLQRSSLAEKAALVFRTCEPGMSLSLVARQDGSRLDCCFSGASSNVLTVVLRWRADAYDALTLVVTKS